MISPSPTVHIRSRSPAADLSSKLQIAKRDSLFLCESDFPLEELSMQSERPSEWQSKQHTPPTSVQEAETKPTATSPVVGAAVTVAEAPPMQIATSLPLHMDHMLSCEGSNSAFSEESLSSSPSKPGACSSGGGLRMSPGSSTKSRKARKRATAKQRQQALFQKQQEKEEKREDKNVSTPSRHSSSTRRNKRNSKKLADSELEDEEQRVEYPEGKDAASPIPSQLPTISLNLHDRSFFDEGEDDTEGWAAEIDRDLSY